MESGNPKTAQVEEKTNLRNIVRQAGFQERERRAGIILKIFCRVQHGFADFRKSREVHDRVETICWKKFSTDTRDRRYRQQSARTPSASELR